MCFSQPWLLSFPMVCLSPLWLVRALLRCSGILSPHLGFVTLESKSQDLPLFQLDMIACSRPLRLGCAQSRGPEETAPLFTAYPTGIWVHCDKGHKTCGLPMNKYPPRVPLHLHVASAQDQWDRAQY